MATPDKPTAPPRVITRLKTPKGTRDWVGQDLLLRDYIFETISTILKRHGGVPLDTPVFELRDILSEKYGEESRLIYNLEDQGGEICSLRYDLTVPFARWLAMNSNVRQIKRYQIAKVYRRDQPAVARGRYREFYQCDFDIAGIYDPMIPDAEILCIISEVFEAFEFDIAIKLNHRRILDGMFAAAGVPYDKIRAVSSSVDKLDKQSWDEVKQEMVETKGISDNIADKVGQFVLRKGPLRETINLLRSDEKLIAQEDIKAGMQEMELLLSYLEAMGVAEKVSFDLSLARGLDYYSGLIFEVIPTTKGSTDVGSIAAGGRYDGLVGMYGKQPVPCVGISFGVDRIFMLLEARQERKASRLEYETDVYIMAFGSKEPDGYILERMKIARELWKAGIRAEFTAKAKPRIQAQFNAFNRARLTVILGQEEVESGQVRLRSASEQDQDQKDKGELVPRENMVEEVRKRLSTLTNKSG